LDGISLFRHHHHLFPFTRFIKHERKVSDTVVLGMPFDVSLHPDAASPVAKEMDQRLRDDLKNYEVKQIIRGSFGFVKERLELNLLLSLNLQDQLNQQDKTTLSVDILSRTAHSLEDKLVFLSILEEAVNEQRYKDLEFVQESFAALVKWSNAVPGLIDNEGAAAPLHFVLSRWVTCNTLLVKSHYQSSRLTCFSVLHQVCGS